MKLNDLFSIIEQFCLVDLFVNEKAIYYGHLFLMSEEKRKLYKNASVVKMNCDSCRIIICMKL